MFCAFLRYFQENAGKLVLPDNRMRCPPPLKPTHLCLLTIYNYLSH